MRLFMYNELTSPLPHSQGAFGRLGISLPPCQCKVWLLGSPPSDNESQDDGIAFEISGSLAFNRP